MTPSLRRILFAAPAFLLALGSAACLLIPEETEQGERVANRRPEVRITAGGSSADSAGIDYKVRFNWHGTDDDGVVALYQFAIDDTVSEGAWTDTTSFSSTFPLSATVVDPEDPTRFMNWHAFYIRAVDNEFARSAVDTRYFNARTIAPSTRFTTPTNLTEYPELLKTVFFEWVGEDLDSSQPDQAPVWFEYKLVEIGQITDTEDVIRDSLYNANNILLDTLTVGSKRGWVRVPASERSLTLRDLPGESSLAFAVRAIDEAGAVEPVLIKGVNFIAFVVQPQPGQPSVTIREASVGSYLFVSNDDVWEIDVSTDRPLLFSWIGDASSYGSQPGNVNYALDIVDVENEEIRDPRGIGGWIGWGRWDRVLRPFIFPSDDGPGRHVLWVKMRDITDSKESERICRIEITVIAFTQHKLALICDDARFQGRPLDEEHDSWLDRNVFRRLFDYGRVDRHDFFGTGQKDERRGRVVRALDLDQVAQYQNIVWSQNLSTGTPLTPAWEIERLQHRLSAHVGAGGNVFVLGSSFLGTMLGTVSTGNLSYPKFPEDWDGAANELEEVGFDFDSFIWKFMHIRNPIVSVPGRGTPEQKEASGMVAARSLNPSYPDIELDRSDYNPEELIDCEAGNPASCIYQGGLGRWEATEANARSVIQEAGLDSIYAVATFNKLYDPDSPDGIPITATVDNAIIAQRYESTRADTLAGTAQGRVFWWGFQPFLFQEQSVQDAGAATINWLVTGRDH